MAAVESIPAGTHCYIEGCKKIFGVIEENLANNQCRTVDLFENRSRSIIKTRLEMIENEEDFENAANQHSQCLKEQEEKESEYMGS